MSESSCLQFFFYFSVLFSCSLSGVSSLRLMRALSAYLFTRFAKFIWRQKHFTSSRSCRRNRLLAGASSGQMSSEAEQQQQQHPQQSCPSVRLWFGYPSPSLALLSLSLPLILSLCFFLCLFPCAYSATVSLANCTKSLHCFADTLCACLRVERKWNACVECKQRTKSNKLQRKLLNNSSQICTVGVQMCCGRLCLHLSAGIPCKRRKG